MKHFFAGLLALITLTGWNSPASAEIKIGINAPRGELAAMKEFGALATYLEQQVGDKITLVPNKVANLLEQTEKGELDFVLANPVQTIIMAEEQGVIPLVTMEQKEGPRFAGVIIAKKGSGITKAEDLKGKKVMALSSSAAAAYVFQSYHLTKKGINPRKDFAAFVEGKKLDDLVLAVNAGVMDAAFIKSGTLEDMAKEGKISLADFVIVDERKDPTFPLLHTTQTYPEWFFTATKKADAATTKKIKAALLKLTPADAACKAATIKGFVDALPLDELKTALKTLQLRPYK
ncbi:MAG: phosphate/phosphite/phosphonate ABC transporter substrate-binding protein [Desulfobulbaceae bacterium]|nr:phosphate/phosphite/phosphonate ABC transporter substrate-binding protein [Desulfobulbaceae bacterium]